MALYHRLRDLFSLKHALVLYALTTPSFEGAGPTDFTQHGSTTPAQAPNPLAARPGRAGRCAFEVAGCEPPYRGVRGRATATVAPDEELATLRRLVERYLGSTDSAFASWLLGRTAPEVVLHLDPLEISSWDYSARMGL